MWAAFNGHLPVVEYLVEKGADIEAKDYVSDFIIKSMRSKHGIASSYSNWYSEDVLHRDMPQEKATCQFWSI